MYMIYATQMFYWGFTYVTAVGETCPLLVRWAPKCICMHLSRQQRSRWKQNSTQEDSGSWDSPRLQPKEASTERGAVPPQNFLIVCSPEESSHSLKLLTLSQLLCGLWRATSRLFSLPLSRSIQKRGAQQVARGINDGERWLCGAPNYDSFSWVFTMRDKKMIDIESSAASYGVVSNRRKQTDPAPRCSRTFRQWFLQCALTCTDARRVVFNPNNSYQPAGVRFQQLQTRDITDRMRALACVHQCLEHTNSLTVCDDHLLYAWAIGAFRCTAG